MKNPKWRCAYPNSHKVKFGGKFLTQWEGYHLTLQQSTGGTISADKLRGYPEQSANLSYTANNDYYFNGWQSTGANIQNSKVPFTQDTTAKANFKWTSAQPGANKRLDYSSNTKSTFADNAKYIHFYTWHKEGATQNSYEYYLYSGGKNIQNITSANVGNYFAFKGNLSVPSNLTGTVNNYCMYFNRVGFYRTTPNANLFPLISANFGSHTKLTYSSNLLTIDGHKIYYPHNNWLTGTKEVAYAVHTTNDYTTITAYYNGVRLAEVSSDNFYSFTDGSKNHIKMGAFHQTGTSTWSGGSTASTIQWQYTTAYAPVNGSYDFHLRNFSTLAATTAWASTPGLV